MTLPTLWSHRNFIAMHINIDLPMISEWSRTNLVNLNPAKSMVLPIYRSLLFSLLAALSLGDDFISYV
jgi:hypothetical protein